MSQDQEYDNTNRGVLFKNNKDGNEKRPDYTGNIDVEGTDYQLSAWLRDYTDGKTGEQKKLLSLSVSKKEDWVSGETREKFAKEEAPANPDAELTEKEKDNITGDEPINLDDIPF